MYKVRRVGIKKRDIEAAAELAPRRTPPVGDYGQPRRQPGKAFGTLRPDYELYPGE